MKKNIKIKGEEERDEQVRKAGIPLFQDPQEALEAVREEAEAAGVSPGAVMATTPEGAVTGSLDEDGDGLLQAPDNMEEIAYEPDDEDSDEDSDEEPSDDDDESDESEDLNDLNVTELKERAKEAGVEGYYNLKKDELIEALK